MEKEKRIRKMCCPGLFPLLLRLLVLRQKCTALRVDSEGLIPYYYLKDYAAPDWDLDWLLQGTLIVHGK